ncbi:MAG: hypothetical protein JW829_16945, partial [Pirellulales bacterium]|nr:hypothetical protein [Pirellulales bacterium]
LAIAWQNVGYNQPPHPSFYLGEGMTLPVPQPDITLIPSGECGTTPITPYVRIDSGTWRQSVNAAVGVGQNVTLGPEPSTGGTWRWTGPNGFTATTREVNLSNLQPVQAGIYTAAYTNACGTQSRLDFNVILKSIMAHYEFEADTTDSSGNGNDGTPAGSPAYATGQIGQAIDLDGADDYVTAPAGVADCDDITISAWINWDGGDAYQRIFDFNNGTAEYMFLTPDNGDGQLRFGFLTAAEYPNLYASALATGVWTHVAITLDGDTGVLYVNGTAQDTQAIMNNPSNLLPQNLFIGKSAWSTNPYFNGRIDDFRVYNYALSASEIAAFYSGTPVNNPPYFSSDSISKPNVVAAVYTTNTLASDANDPDGDSLTFSKDSGSAWLSVATDGSLSGTPGVSDEGANSFTVRVTDPAGAFDTATLNIMVLPVQRLVLHYEFEDNVDDSSDDGNDGYAHFGPGYSSGQYGQAIEMDGEEDMNAPYIDLPPGAVGSDDITIAAWVYWDGGDAYQRIFDIGNGEYEYMFLTPDNGSNQLRFGFKTAAEYPNLYASAMSTGVWTHVAVTLNGNTGVLYVNGTAADTQTIVNNPSDMLPQNNYLGKSQWSHDPFFNGRIDEFRIYNYALTAGEIKALCTGLPPYFHSDPFYASNATLDVAYSASISDSAIDPDDDPLSYNKVSGPAWLNVAGDGSLSGTPSNGVAGLNSFIVEVTDNISGSDQATLNINVVIGESSASVNSLWITY